MVRTSYLTYLIIAATIHISVQAYRWDTITAFALPAHVVNSYMNKRTVADVRSRAEWIIDAYENHHIYVTIDEISAAYRIVNSTDEELQNKIWWENKFVAAFAGLFTAVLYRAIMYPSKNSLSCMNHKPGHCIRTIDSL